jgi:hypothetical protein
MKRVLLYAMLLSLLISCGKNTEVAKLLPAISTTSVSGINATEATCGGNITAEGSANVSARGIVWSDNSNPTIDLLTKTSDGAGPGSSSERGWYWKNGILNQFICQHRLA